MKASQKLFTLLFFLIISQINIISCEQDNSIDTGLPDDGNLPELIEYKIVGTGQVIFYNEQNEIPAPSTSTDFYGQNATYTGNTPTYVDNSDGTITDMVTGLMWQKSADINGDGDINYDDKMSYDEAITYASEFDLAGYTDWRLPTIKEQYSLIMFYGIDPSGYNGTDTENLTPFINTEYFEIAYGDVTAGERIIDAQFATSTKYVSTTMMGNETMFGVNFVDGRIKGYPTDAMPGQTEDKQFYVLYVRGNANYGTNNFVDNSDGTISDNASGLMWMQDDASETMAWKDALSYAENKDFAGYSDWRLPNAKELQSIVDYTRSPATSNSAAIDPIFNCTAITNEAGVTDYSHYWSSTTHANMSNVMGGSGAAYICFGRAMGNMQGNWMDVHGAGAQRSDPKIGNPDDYPEGHGPQGDAIRIYNQVRLVRNIN